MTAALHLTTKASTVLRECAMASETFRRVHKVLDRVLPVAPIHVNSHEASTVASVLNGWERIDRSRERRVLYRAILPRIEAKVRAKFAREDARMESAVESYRAVVSSQQKGEA